MATKKQVMTNIENAVKDQFLKGVSENVTAGILMNNEVEFSDVQAIIESTARRLKLILSVQEIKQKIADSLKDVDKPDNFYSLVEAVGKLNIVQLSNDELLKATQEHFKTNLTASAKYTCFFNGKGHYGKIADWIRENPDFTNSELLNSDVIKVNNNREEDYYNQFIGFRDFFKSVQS